MLIKVCGVKDADFAIKACQMGVNALGFNFYKKSVRYINPDEAKNIVQLLPPFVARVGVFVNAPITEVLDIAQNLDLDYIQLHGDETAEYAMPLKQYKLIKAIRVQKPLDLELVDESLKIFDYVLLDTKVSGAYGGTGKNFNWSMLRQIKKNHLSKIIVAGGITPENVAELMDYNIFAIDVNSGIEYSPGVKDSVLLKKLIQIVRSER